jgi:hypothetical protein
MTTSSFAFAALLALAAGAPKDAPGGPAASTAEERAADLLAFREYKVRADRLIASADPMTAPVGEERSLCHLGRQMADGSSSSECTLCHAGGSKGPQLHTSHPFDVDHDLARTGSRAAASSLRPAAEVVRRGVFLPGGKVTCLTCHDGRSPWRYRLALPPDALVRDPVVPGNARTYDPELRSRQQPLTVAAAMRILPVGTEVSPTPLCKVCHSFGD